MEKIKIPDSLSDMNLSHLPFYFAVTKLRAEVKTTSDLRPEEVSDLNALFFGFEFDYFDKFTHQSNLDLLNNIIDSTEKRKPEPIRTEIEANGVKYLFQTDYSKVPTSFHRDTARCNIQETPADLLGFAYIEQGMTYNKTDEDSIVILNPRQDRSKALLPHFNLAQYLDVHAFFLESLPVLRLSYLESQLLKAMGR